MLRAFEASGKSVDEFADMYGLGLHDANRTLDRARARAVKSATGPVAAGVSTEASVDASVEHQGAGMVKTVNTPV